MSFDESKLYPWQREFIAWRQAEEAKPGYSGSVRMSDVPDAKLSDVLRCLDAVRATPEVWDKVVEQSKRPYVDPGDVASDHPEVARSNDVSYFVRQFIDWYRMNNGLHDASWGYSALSRVLDLIARGELQRDDLPALKARLGPLGITDDIDIATLPGGGTNG